MSSFDADTFLSSAVEGESETHFVPVEEGEYVAIIDNIGAKEVTTKNGEATILDVFYEILDDEVKVVMGMEKVVVKQSIFLDMEANGALVVGEKNKNVKLGKLREAVNQNTSAPWSFRDLKGAGPLMIKVSQRPDQNDSSIVYNDVQRTAAMP